MVLTPSGKEFMEHASRILYDVNKAKKSMNDDAELKNPLHIGTIESLHSKASGCSQQIS